MSRINSDCIVRYFSYFFGNIGVPYDNDNVNTILAGDQLYSITESGGMTKLDKSTLEKQGRVCDHCYCCSVL